jgi:hypothetical protein
LALRYACESSTHSPLSPTIQEKLVRIFTDHIEIQYEFQKRQEPLTTISDLDAVVDRFEAVLYDMGDVADEYNDKNTRIYLTIMAERLVTMAKSFNNEVKIKSNHAICRLSVLNVDLSRTTAYQ